MSQQQADNQTQTFQSKHLFSEHSWIIIVISQLQSFFLTFFIY